MEEKTRQLEATLAGFRQVYESRDGRFATYADAAGHWTSVNTAKFASASEADASSPDDPSAEGVTPTPSAPSATA